MSEPVTIEVMGEQFTIKCSPEQKNDYANQFYQYQLQSYNNSHPNNQNRKPFIKVQQPSRKPGI